MEPSIFYISSRGSSACEWLAKMLSRHPQIVCFRSTRSLPPYGPGVGHPEISADDFMEGLMECVRATHGEKIFGSVHGYHGSMAKEPCEKRGGRFSYIIRHPISRVHSAYIFYLDQGYYKKFAIAVENKNIHDRVCSNLLANSDLRKYTEAFGPEINRESCSGPRNRIRKFAKKVLPKSVIKNLAALKSGFSQKGRYLSVLKAGLSQEVPNEKEYAALQFVALANEFLRCDHELFESCSSTCGIKMEEMVKNREYFRNHLCRLVAPGLEISDAYLGSVFNESRFNVHRDKVLSPQEIWKSWPAGMKDAFMKYFEFYNVSAICKAFDYDISFL